MRPAGEGGAREREAAGQQREGTVSASDGDGAMENFIFYHTIIKAKVCERVCLLFLHVVVGKILC